MTNLCAHEVAYTYKNKFQTVHAVRGIDYEFSAGHFYAIVGKSGCGKTTFLSLLAGLDIPSVGSIAFNGAATDTLNRNDLRRDHIAVIYQSYNLFPLLTVLENVMYPLALKKTSRKEAARIAKEQLLAVGLGDEYHRRLPSMLSGGEQQRVAIARSLVGGHSVILADEPTGNLDTENGTAIIDMLARLAHEQNILVIVVTHDPEVSSRADVILSMRDGRLAVGAI
ncbi:MAG: ABC transporter ATP-binding protein [Clostridiales bacterium]|nr:ABC transporter ATP-binding protein [Clostridiales bacterium]